MKKKFVTYICYMIMLLFCVIFTMISPLLMSIADTFLMNMTQAGFIFGANYIGFIVFITIGGILADRIGKKVLLSVTFVGLTAVLSIVSYAPNYIILYFLMALIGGLNGIIQSQVSALIAELNPENPDVCINISQIFCGFGALMGPLMASTILKNGLSWQYCYHIMAGLMLIATVVFILTKLPQLPRSEAITWGDFKMLMKNRKFVVICFCMILYAGSEVGGWGWLSTFLKKDMNFSIEQSSFVVSVFFGSLTIGRIVCGFLMRRFELRIMIIALACLSAGTTVITYFIHSQIAIWLIITILGFTYSSQWSLIASYGTRVCTGSSSTAFAMLVGSSGIGMAGIPCLMGVIGESFSIRLAMVSPAVLLFIIAMIFMNIEKKSISYEKAYICD